MQKLPIMISWDLCMVRYCVAARVYPGVCVARPRKLVVVVPLFLAVLVRDRIMKIPIGEIFDAARYWESKFRDKTLAALLEEWYIKGIEAGMNLKTESCDLEEDET